MRKAITRGMLEVAAGAALFLVTCLLAAGQTGTGRQPKKSDYAELKKAPEKMQSRANPFEGNPDAAAVGKKLFGVHCAECHGTTADGARRGPSLRVHDVEEATPGTLFWLLTNGAVRRGMPPWSRLPEPQRWQLVSYLKSLE